MSLRSVVTRLAADLDALGVPWALVGGLAYVVQVQTRFTHDVDVAIPIDDEAEQDRLVRSMGARGYRLFTGPIQRLNLDQLFGVRLIPPGKHEEEVVVDLLFSASGLEGEIVDNAEQLLVFPDLVLPVVSKGHLLATKLLAWRKRDQLDAEEIAAVASKEDIATARKAIALMHERGLDKKRNDDREAADFEPLSERLREVLAVAGVTPSTLDGV